MLCAVSRCGKCCRYLKYIAAKPQRMYCSHCNETYSLPQGGSIKLYKEIKCPLDKFELLMFSSPAKVRVQKFFCSIIIIPHVLVTKSFGTQRVDVIRKLVMSFCHV